MEKSKFELKDSYGYHFNFITANIKRLLEQKTKEYDITSLQFGILLNIHKNNLTTQKEFLRFTNGDEASITRLIDRLEAKDYIQRVRDPNDKRKKQIKLTSSGVSLIEKLIPYAQNINKTIADSLKQNEQKELLRLLQKVNLGVKEATKELYKDE